MLEEELKKPAKKRNYDKIEELTGAYAELIGTKTEVRNAMQRCLSELKSKARPKKKITRRMRVLFTAVSVAVLLFIMNIVTVSAFDLNVFSFIVHVADGSFSVDFPQSSAEKFSGEILELSATPDDPYGIIAECAKYGLYPETPHYLPDGFVLTNIGYSNISLYETDATFTFTNTGNEKQHITFSYNLFKNKEDLNNTGFLNNEHCFSEIEVNGKSALLAEEKKDKQFTFVTCNENLLSSFFTQNMLKPEVDNIINSIY